MLFCVALLYSAYSARAWNECGRTGDDCVVVLSNGVRVLALWLCFCCRQRTTRRVYITYYTELSVDPLPIASLPIHVAVYIQ